MDRLRVNGQVQDGIINVYDRRNGVTIFCCFKDVLSYKCSKFLGVEATTTMESGWNNDTHYQACKHIFEIDFHVLEVLMIFVCVLII
jgi:hypothetical protein